MSLARTIIHGFVCCRMVRIAKNDIVLNDIVIRKHARIAIPIYAIHHDPDVWHDPDKFDPERYVDVDCIFVSEYASVLSFFLRVCTHTHGRTSMHSRSQSDICMKALTYAPLLIDPLTHSLTRWHIKQNVVLCNVRVQLLHYLRVQLLHYLRVQLLHYLRVQLLHYLRVQLLH